MDKFERQEILDEFLIKWHAGTSPKSTETQLINSGYNPDDIKLCRKIFERWIESKTSWKEIKNLK